VARMLRGGPRGRYREVKRLCRAVGLVVQRLRRVAFGSLKRGTLPPGGWRELTPVEVGRLAASRPGLPLRPPRAPPGACLRPALAWPILCGLLDAPLLEI
jgi:hypothetical protein